MNNLKKILIIDDDPLYQELFKQIFAITDYECFYAHDGLEGLVKIEEYKPDIILLDVDMPDIDGVEVCRRLKAHHKTRNIPIIFISGIDKYLKQQLYCLEIGGDAYLSKPFKTNELMTMIEKLLVTKELHLIDFYPPDTQIPKDQIPQKVFSGYKILEFIGSGWMCTVYKTLQMSLNRIVALKVFSRNLSKDKVFINQFEKETNLFASIDHPNIVSIIDKGKEGDFYYFTTEYVNGRSLSHYFRNMNLDTRHYIQIITELGRAVNHLHKHNITHKYLTPHRIIIDNYGTLKLSDFAFSASKEFLLNKNNFTTEENFGYLNYQSPEMKLPDKEINHLSDIYSLGVIFYEMLTKAKPSKEYKNPSEINPVLNRQIDDILKTAINKDPKKRFDSVADFCQNLINAIDKTSNEYLFKTAADKSFPQPQNIFADLMEEDGTGTQKILKVPEKKYKYKDFFYIIVLLFFIGVFAFFYFKYSISSISDINNTAEKKYKVLPLIKFDPELIKISNEEIIIDIDVTNAEKVAFCYINNNKIKTLNFIQITGNLWSITIPRNSFTNPEVQYYIAVDIKDTQITIPPAIKNNFFKIDLK